MSKKGGVATAAQLVKLLVPAGKASAQPPVGPALGAKGVKAMDFAKVGVLATNLFRGHLALSFVINDAPLHIARKLMQGSLTMDLQEFNARTAHLEPGLPTPTLVTVNPDRTFTFETRTPPTSLLLKRAAGITAGSGRPGSEFVGDVSLKHIYEIAKIKMRDVKGIGEEQVSNQRKKSPKGSYQKIC